MQSHVPCSSAVKRRMLKRSTKRLPPASTFEAARLFRKQVLLTDSQCFLCRCPRSTKAFCCCGSRPTGISVRRHHGCPAAPSTHPSVPYTTHCKSSYRQESQFSSLEYLLWLLLQVTSYTFQLNSDPSTTPRGTRTAQNNYAPDVLVKNDVHSRQEKAQTSSSHE